MTNQIAKSLAGSLVAVAVLGLAIPARAVPTALELGSVDPGSPADPTADETPRLITLVAGYNDGLSGTLLNSFTGDSSHTYVLAPAAGVPAAPLPSVGTNIGQNSGGGGVQTGLSVNLGAGGYSYVMVKWGNEDEFYYIGGLTGTITINNDVNGNGESHYDLFTGGSASVPENGSTLTLLGLAVLGLVAVSRIARLASVQ